MALKFLSVSQHENAFDGGFNGRSQVPNEDNLLSGGFSVGWPGKYLSLKWLQGMSRMLYGAPYAVVPSFSLFLSSDETGDIKLADSKDK